MIKRMRRVALAISALGAVALSACGSSAAPGSSSAGAQTPTPVATPTPLPTSTPGPASEQGTLTGDARITGPLNSDGPVHFVNCDEPSLDGPTIQAFGNAADPSVGVFLTIRAGFIAMRLGSGSGATYTERDFTGTGVTSFSPASGAQYSSSVTETTAAGGNKGTVESMSSISGWVSCGTFATGGGTITVAGDTGHGTIAGALTSLRVGCGGSVDRPFATVAGLTHVGSALAVVNLAGGTLPSPFFVSVSSASGFQQFKSTSPTAVTFPSSGVVTYNATATEATASTTGIHTVTVSGTATCGT
jgi:hypothetical protein